MKIILFLLLILGLVSCAKKPIDYVARDRAYIIDRLGGHAVVELVQPPVGPFNLVAANSRYWKAHVPKTGKTFWVEAYVSLWTLAGNGDPVYLYRFYEKIPLTDIYRTVKK